MLATLYKPPDGAGGIGRNRCHRIRHDDGVSLIEFVVAAAILFIVVVAIMGALTFSAQATQMGAKRVSGLNLANQRIEQARNLPYDDVGVYYTSGGYADPPGAIPHTEQVNDFTVDTQVTWARDEATGRATYKNISITVSWELPRNGSVTLETSIYGKSSLVNTGDVSILVVDADTGEPVEGVSVSLDPASGSARALRSDASGEVFFGFVPSGAADVDATSSDYILDLNGVTPTEIVPDSLTRLTIYAQKPSTAIITVVDSSGSPISGADVAMRDAYGNEWTGQTGGGEVTFDPLLRGWYDVEARATGYASSSTSFEIPAGDQTVRVELVLPDAAGLTVTVTSSENGLPIAGASVSAYGPLPSTPHVPGSPAGTDADGVASFDIYAPGMYRVVAEMADYTSASTEIAMTPGSTYNLDLALDPIVTGSLRIHVVDRRGRDNGYGRVRVWNETRDFDQIITADLNGDIQLDGLTPGRYTVSGLPGTMASTDVIAGQTSMVTVMSR